MDFTTLGEIISIDSFIQGLIFIFLVSLGCLVFFSDSFKLEIYSNESAKRPSALSGLNNRFTRLFLEAFSWLLTSALKLDFVKKTEQTAKDANTNTAKAAHIIGKHGLLASILFFAAITMGIFAKSAGEVWVKKENMYHFGMQQWWKPVNKDSLRVNMFNKIYLRNQVKQDSIYREMNDFEKIQHYYFASNKVSEDQHYGKLLKESRNRGEYAQVFTLSFFVLFVLCWLNLISTRFRVFMKNFDLARLKMKDPESESYYKTALKVSRQKGQGLNPVLNYLLVIVVVFVVCYFIPYTREFMSGDFIQQFIRISVWVLTLSPIVIWASAWYNYRLKTDDHKDLELLATKPEYDGTDFSNRNIFTTHYFTVILLYFGLIGYIVSASVWKKSEREKVSKSYGYYVNIDETISKQKENALYRHLKVKRQDVVKSDTNKKAEKSEIEPSGGIESQPKVGT